MAKEKRKKTLSQVALKSKGGYNDDFLLRARKLADRWEDYDPEKLREVLDLRTDDGFFRVLIQDLPKWDEVKDVASNGLVIAKEFGEDRYHELDARKRLMHFRMIRHERAIEPLKVLTWVGLGFFFVLCIFIAIAMIALS